MKQLTTLTILILLFVPLLALNFSVTAEEPEWILESRGENYDIFYNSLNASQRLWVSAPQRVQNVTGEWVDYILTEEADYVQVQTGLIGAKIFDAGYAEFYSPDMSEVRVFEERWVDEYWSEQGQGGWKVCNTYNPTRTIIEDSDFGVNVTLSFITDWPNSGERAFDVKYIFRIGQPLKHEIVFVSHSADSYDFRVKQCWAGIVGNKVKHEKGTDVIADVIASATVVDSSYFRFLKEDGSLSVLENQWSMYYDEFGEILSNQNLKPVEIGVHAQGMKADFVFGDWTLAQNERLEIDPATATLDDPTEDGTISKEYFAENYARYNVETTLGIGADGTYYYMSYSEWNVITIPDGATITDTVFKYAGNVNDIDCRIYNMTVKPSTSTDEQVFGGMGTIYADPDGFPVAGNNQQVDLGATADSDLQSQLTANWFAIGIAPDEWSLHYSSILSENFVGPPVPPPTLYVEYYEPAYITLETDPVGLEVRLDEGTWYNSPHEFEVESGTSHSIECNPIQSGGTRTQYLFQSWNDSGANPHSVSPTGNATYVATYKTQYQAYIQSYPEGSGYVEFDGSPITTPYTSGWFDSGLNRSVEATNVTVTANQERYNWSSWSDGKAISHNITIDGEAYVAYFSHEWFFKVNSIYDSPTGQEWYSDGDSTVNSTITSPSDGYDVTGWIGTGSLTSGDTEETNGTGVFTISEYSTCNWLWSYSPSFDSFSASKSSVESHEVFTVSTVLTDETGYTDFVNASVELSHDLILLWQNSTNTFSINYDPNGYATLHGDSSKTVLSATSIRLTWELSLNDEFPSGGVNVVEAGTKVYDGSDLMDSGSKVGLFIFQEESIRGSGALRGDGRETYFGADSFVEDVISPTILVVTDNMFTVFLLATLGLGAVLAYREDHPVWMVLATVFGVLAVNFFLLFVAVPHYSGLSFIEGWLLRLPALELSTYSLANQQVLQVVVVGFMLAAFLVPIFLVAKNQ